MIPFGGSGREETRLSKNMVRMAGFEPAHLAALPPQSSVSANSTTCENVTFSSEKQLFSWSSKGQKGAILTAVLTRTRKRGRKKRFQRVANGLYRFKRTGTIYAVFKSNGRTRWKSLATDQIARARQLLAEEIKNASCIDWRQAGMLTVRKLIEMYEQNPMGLTNSTLAIRKHLLNVFQRTWNYGLGIKVSNVKPIMLKSWLAERRKEQSLKASGVNNYVRTLHG
ncbi:MAG: hypothetical protein KBH45_14180, partial [Verrucomicrobia bacterium]|nr:hypothetical protein [Verrucomicrobiota bacterium]